MTLTEFYAAVGGSYEDASARLQNDAFIGRFLRMLPRDDNMARLTAPWTAAAPRRLSAPSIP